jgi:hypothetical protein
MDFDVSIVEDQYWQNIRKCDGALRFLRNPKRFYRVINGVNSCNFIKYYLQNGLRSLG